ncbi:hypothetical protein D9611_012106 [Ephemerocybe angulata]|uniref:F-box domain-containing protein n=1 Tax=Ephemerocybe angulata TaxID=980116 RepID=A0A8H5ES32_9AGAR|nr:hypothetical protein D9611_012106 [Tulosesus angulatus]
MDTQLFDLPSELLLKVFAQLDLRELRALVCTSRRTNALAIPILVDLTCPQIRTQRRCQITSISEYSVYPFRLAFSLPPIRLRSAWFNIVTSHCDLVKGIHGVADILSRVGPGMEKARLSFAVSQWGATGQRRIKQAVDKSVWVKEIFGVLGMLLDRGCEVIEIDGTQDDLRLLSSPSHHNYFEGNWIGSISRALAPPTVHGEHTRRLSLSRLLGSRTPHHTEETPGTTQGTREIALRNCDCMYQPFILCHTIAFVNSVSVQCLRLDSRTMSKDDWGLCLTTLLLPNLTTCEFGVRRAEGADVSYNSRTMDSVDLLYFLGRHPTIKVFHIAREVPEDGRLRNLAIPTRMKLEKSQPLLPLAEEVKGSVRFFHDLLQWNCEAVTPKGAFPALQHIHVEPGFLSKGNIKSSIASLHQLLALILTIYNAGGLQSLTRIGIDSQTYASSPQFTVLDLLVSEGNLLSASLSGLPDPPRLVLPFIRTVTLATFEWINKAASGYTDAETRAIFRQVHALFPGATDLHFGLMKSGVWSSLKLDWVKREVANICPVLERIHPGHVGGSETVVELGEYR